MLDRHRAEPRRPDLRLGLDAGGHGLQGPLHGTTDAADCGVISNTAVATSGNDGGGTSTATVTVQCPDVEVTKTPDNGIVNAGDPITWTIKVENLGPGNARGVDPHRHAARAASPGAEVGGGLLDHVRRR